jgi:uncharacterized protein YndB with AHSA1/START domain
MSEKYDLVFERNTNMTIDQIWKGWSDPATLMKWFCPLPWKVVDCRIDLRPGGEFYTLMQSPEGESFPNNGCFLEIIPNQKIVWTNMMTKNYQPMPIDNMGFSFSITLMLTNTTSGVNYKAIVAHSDKDGMQKHEQMGFHQGWGIAFEQFEKLYS